jgi:hypothetical protein
MRCANTGCGRIINNSDKTKHEAKCPKALLRCMICEKVARDAMEQHKRAAAVTDPGCMMNPVA